MKKLIKGILIVIGILAIIAVVLSFTLDEETKLKARTDGGGISWLFPSGGASVDLIGTGRDLNGGVASTTAQATIFQFASSTDDTYWDENNPERFPDKLMTATATASMILNNADSVTFEFTYNPFVAASVMSCSFFQTNDTGCESNATSTAELYPLTLNASTTPSDIGSVGVATTTIEFTGDTEVKHTLTIDSINARCLILQCGNASTTDGSLLYVNARTK